MQLSPEHPPAVWQSFPYRLSASSVPLQLRRIDRLERVAAARSASDASQDLDGLRADSYEVSVFATLYL